jgi:hypothetical protein
LKVIKICTWIWKRLRIRLSKSLRNKIKLRLFWSYSSSYNPILAPKTFQQHLLLVWIILYPLQELPKKILSKTKLIRFFNNMVLLEAQPQKLKLFTVFLTISMCRTINLDNIVESSHQYEI